MNSSVALPWARVPLVVGLLLGAGSALQLQAQPLASLDLSAVWWPWMLGVGLAMVTMIVVLIGRASPQPRTVLAVEGVVAGLLALVPPPAWVVWLGLGPLTTALGGSSGRAFVQGLAIAWLAVVLVTAARRPEPRHSVAGERSAPR